MGEVTSYTKIKLDELIGTSFVDAEIVSGDLVLTRNDDTTLVVPLPEGNVGDVTQEDLANAIAALVDSSPSLLNTLNEIAAALNDDPDFATTITNLLNNHITDITDLHGIDNTNNLLRVVVHGGVAGTTRPAGGASIVVHWIGSVEPTNAVDNDLWTNIT